MDAYARDGVARRVFELVIVATFAITTLLTILSILVSGLGKDTAGNRDFIEYWAAGQLLAHHQNPYDAKAIEKLERTEGLSKDKPALVMGNAPPALLITVPLGLFRARTGQRIWTALLITALLFSVRLVRAALGAGKAYISILALGFAPALVCIAVGQMAMLVLLGFALFLSFYRTRPLLAGASLWLCLLKPQLFVPWGAVLAIWMWRSRQSRLFAGVGISMLASTLLIGWLDPGCWHQYGAMMKLERYDMASIPCLSMVLRDLSGGKVAVQYAPVLLACVWAIIYFWRHRDGWDWIKHGSSLALVSLLAAPYCWFVDQCLAIPALMHGSVLTRSRLLIAVLASASVVIEIAPLYGRSLLHSNFYLWTAPAWLIWYIAAARSSAKRAPSMGIFDPHERGTVSLSTNEGVATVEAQ